MLLEIVSCGEIDRQRQSARYLMMIIMIYINPTPSDEYIKLVCDYFQIDVVGVCPTDYTVSQKGWKSSQFTKSKDLLGCSDRHDYRIALQSTPFRLPDVRFILIVYSLLLNT